jgi:Zn-dependent protease
LSEIEIIKLVTVVLALLIAIIGHEIMHGYVAYRYGDMTAKLSGRLSINPIPHIDPVGSLILPLALHFLGSPFIIGWAKPVPVDIDRVIQNGGYLGALNVALGGVAYNFTLAIVVSMLLSNVAPPTDLTEAFFYSLMFQLIVINVILGVFNLWIVPRFDGANALIYLSLMFGMKKVYFTYKKLEPFSLPILFVILFIPQLQAPLFYPARMLLGELLP